MGKERSLVVALTGASGVVYGLRTLEVLQHVPDLTTHVVVTNGARETLAYEQPDGLARVQAASDIMYRARDTAARIASGSFPTSGMIVVPCSIKTLSAIANSYDNNLVVRAADVTLKERRRLVLVVRETPLHLGHLRLMTLAAAAGAVILPPVPAFYNRPASVQEIVDHTVGRILDQFDIDAKLFDRWEGPGRAAGL